MNDHRSQDSKALTLVKKLADYGINGVGPLTSAADLAEEYRVDKSYRSADDRVVGLIRWEAAKNFTSGFLTGLGGLITLPISVPGALAAAWVIQARLCGAVAALYGHSLKSDRLRTLVLLVLLGDTGKEVLKQAGVQVGKKLSVAIIQRVPGRVLIEINKRIGFRLLTKAGEKGIINLMKLVPLFGGLVGGTVDATACVLVGRSAKNVFKTAKRKAQVGSSGKRRAAPKPETRNGGARRRGRGDATRSRASRRKTPDATTTAAASH